MFHQLTPRRTTSTYPNLAYPAQGAMTEVKWYKYDSLGRMVVAEGVQTGGTVTEGTLVTYNAAGERATATKGNAGLTGQAWTWVWYQGYGPPYQNEYPIEFQNGEYQYVNVSYSGARRETYTYNADGQLTHLHTATTGYTDNGDGTVTPTNVFGANEIRAITDRDAMGRIEFRGHYT